MIADMMMKNSSASDDNEEDYETEKGNGSTLDSSVKTEKFLKKYEDMPEHWDPMEEKLISKTVSVYFALFHHLPHNAAFLRLKDT